MTETYDLEFMNLDANNVPYWTLKRRENITGTTVVIRDAHALWELGTGILVGFMDFNPVPSFLDYGQVVYRLRSIDGKTYRIIRHYDDGAIR